MWQNSGTTIVTKLKNSNCDKTQKLKLWQLQMGKKTQKVTKLKNSNVTKLKMWQNSKTQIVTLLLLLTLLFLLLITILLLFLLLLGQTGIAPSVPELKIRLRPHEVSTVFCRHIGPAVELIGFQSERHTAVFYIELSFSTSLARQPSFYVLNPGCWWVCMEDELKQKWRSWAKECWPELWLSFHSVLVLVHYGP